MSTRAALLRYRCGICSALLDINPLHEGLAIRFFHSRVISLSLLLGAESRKIRASDCMSTGVVPAMLFECGRGECR